MIKKIITICLLVLVLGSCVGRGAHPVKRKGETFSDTYNIRGEVLWKSEVPIVYPIPTTAYKGVCGGRKGYSALRLVSARLWHKRLLDVAVWLEPVWEKMEAADISGLKPSIYPEHQRQIKVYERSCDFHPRLSMVPIGGMVEVINEDRKDHWLVVEGRHKKREQYIQRYGEPPSVFTLETPGIHHVPPDAPIEIMATKSDIWHLMSGMHRWMDAWVIVTDKIWYDTVDAKGLFVLEDVPRGIYRVHAWHPLLGENSSVIRVPDDIHGTIAVTFNKIPERIERITSSLITTESEVKEQMNIWRDLDDW